MEPFRQKVAAAFRNSSTSVPVQCNCECHALTHPVSDVKTCETSKSLRHTPGKNVIQCHTRENLHRKGLLDATVITSEMEQLISIIQKFHGSDLYNGLSILDAVCSQFLCEWDKIWKTSKPEISASGSNVRILFDKGDEDMMLAVWKRLNDVYIHFFFKRNLSSEIRKLFVNKIEEWLTIYSDEDWQAECRRAFKGALYAGKNGWDSADLQRILLGELSAEGCQNLEEDQIISMRINELLPGISDSGEQTIELLAPCYNYCMAVRRFDVAVALLIKMGRLGEALELAIAKFTLVGPQPGTSIQLKEIGYYNSHL